jgi:hypothetical protein
MPICNGEKKLNVVRCQQLVIYLTNMNCYRINTYPKFVSDVLNFILSDLSQSGEK